MNGVRMTFSDIENVIFDLDGTLINPLEGITETYRALCSFLDVELPNSETISSFIGPNIQTVLSETFSLSGRSLDEAIAIFRSMYGGEHLLGYTKYPGIDVMLSSLLGLNKRLFIATSKMQTMAVRLVEHAQWGRVFVSVAGVRPEVGVVSKISVLSDLVRQHHLEPKNTLMVGDRGADIRAAHELNLSSVGVLWGFGSVVELTEAEPDVLISATDVLQDILI